MRREMHGFLYWTPRLLSILFLLFLAMFSLDVFDMNLGFWGTVAGLCMHNIPTFILSIVLIVSWKHEIVGGVVFILAGIVYVASLLIRSPFQWYMLSWSLTVAGPAFLIGILFMIGWFKKREEVRQNTSRS